MINLDQLRTLLGEEKLVDKYIVLFKETGPKNIQTIKEAFDKKDTKSLHIATHSLKTQFAYLEHEEALKITLFLENVDKDLVDKKDTAVISAIKSLSQILDQILLELKDYSPT